MGASNSIDQEKPFRDLLPTTGIKETLLAGGTWSVQRTTLPLLPLPPPGNTLEALANLKFKRSPYIRCVLGMMLFSYNSMSRSLLLFLNCIDVGEV